MKEVLNAIFAILFLGGLAFVAIASCIISAEFRHLDKKYDDEDENNE